MQEQLHALIANHCAWLADQIALIAETLAPLAGDDGGDPQETLSLAREQTHQITGSSGTMGFPELGEAARELEYCLAAHAQAPGRLAAAERAQIFSLFTEMRALGSNISAEKSALYGVDLSKIAAR